MPECRSACAAQVFALFRGQKPDLALIAGCGYNPSGSQNWPHGQKLAQQDWDGLGELARIERREGLRRTEAFSELYDPDVVAYRVGGLARMPAAHASRSDVAAALRAQLAFYAITAQPGPRRHTSLDMAGEISETEGDAAFYSGGVSVAVPGHRFHPSVVGQGLLGPILAWALGYPATYVRRRISADVSTNFWPLALLELALGAPYGQETPEAAWGLQPGDRAALCGLIDTDDPAGLDHALAALGDFPLFGPLEIEAVGTEGGRTVRLIHAVNTMKPQLVACHLSDGNYFAAVPQRFSRLQAGLATSTDTGAAFRAVGSDGSTIDVPYAPGAELFRCHWGGAFTPARRAGTAPGPRPIPTEPTPPEPAPAPSPEVPLVQPLQPLQPVEPAQPLPDRAAELRAIAAEIAGRQLPAKAAFAAQRELQRRIVAELESGAPARPLASIADDLDSFDIGAWAPLAAQLRAMAANMPLGRS
ncbi:MAG TPA: hypothetical protein VJA16_22145 [Thermoanaerobaculia bacterium]